MTSVNTSFCAVEGGADPRTADKTPPAWEWIAVPCQWFGWHLMMLLTW